MQEDQYMNIVSELHEKDITELFLELKSQHSNENKDFIIKHSILDLSQNKIFHLEFPMDFNGSKLKDIIKSEEQWVDKTNLNNIDLGNNNYIVWKDVDWANEPSFNIDKLIEPLSSLFDGLESICQTMCCGIGAFDFTSENIRELKNIDRKHLINDLNIVIHEITKIEEQVVNSGRLNQLFEKSVFIKLLYHLRNSLS